MERHKNKLPQSNYTDIYGGSYLLLWHARRYVSTHCVQAALHATDITSKPGTVVGFVSAAFKHARFCVICGYHSGVPKQDPLRCVQYNVPDVFIFITRQSGNTPTLGPPEPKIKTTLRIAGNYSGVC
jgi:hypothetical protein